MKILLILILVFIQPVILFGQEKITNISILKRKINETSIDSITISNINKFLSVKNLQTSYYEISAHGPRVFAFIDTKEDISFWFYSKDSTFYQFATSNPNIIIENKTSFLNMDEQAVKSIYGPPDQINSFGLYYFILKAEFLLNSDTKLISIALRK
jgi:hypothetical protein